MTHTHLDHLGFFRRPGLVLVPELTDLGRCLRLPQDATNVLQCVLYRRQSDCFLFKREPMSHIHTPSLTFSMRCLSASATPALTSIPLQLITLNRRKRSGSARTVVRSNVTYERLGEVVDDRHLDASGVSQSIRMSSEAHTETTPSSRTWSGRQLRCSRPGACSTCPCGTCGRPRTRAARHGC